MGRNTGRKKMFPSAWEAEGFLYLGAQGKSEWETFIEEVAFRWIGFSKDEQNFTGKES